VKKRLDVYHNQTEPLIGYYKKWKESGDKKAPVYIRVHGIGKVEEIRDQIFAAVEKFKK
jgi:adenylate kinase